MTHNATMHSMSASGHKPTYAPQNVISALPRIATAKATSRKTHVALPPKADMCSANIDVRYGPKADIRYYLAERSLHARPGLTCGYQRFHWLLRLAKRRQRGSSLAAKSELNHRIRAPILESFR